MRSSVSIVSASLALGLLAALLPVQAQPASQAGPLSASQSRSPPASQPGSPPALQRGAPLASQSGAPLASQSGSPLASRPGSDASPGSQAASPAASASKGASQAVSPSGPQPTSVRYLAGNCANCHGTDGRPAGGAVPGLAGLSPEYFIEQMRLFRDGKRQATIMHQLAKGYTDEQVAALADYFAKQAPAR